MYSLLQYISRAPAAVGASIRVVWVQDGAHAVAVHVGAPAHVDAKSLRRSVHVHVRTAGLVRIGSIGDLPEVFERHSVPAAQLADGVLFPFALGR